MRCCRTYSLRYRQMYRAKRIARPPAHPPAYIRNARCRHSNRLVVTTGRKVARSIHTFLFSTVHHNIMYARTGRNGDASRVRFIDIFFIIIFFLVFCFFFVFLRQQIFHTIHHVIFLGYIFMSASAVRRHRLIDSKNV